MSTNSTSIAVGELRVDLVRKDIKNLHLGVYPPNGRVRIAVPLNIPDDAVRAAITRKMAWIKKQQAEFLKQERQGPREGVSGETYYFFGEKRRMKLVDSTKRGEIKLPSKKYIELHIDVDASTEKKLLVIDRWYRAELLNYIERVLPHWQEVTALVPNSWSIRKMKTRWGSCDGEQRKLTFNLELVKKSPQCLDYILVHELIHLVEPLHNDNFVKLMDAHLPNWRAHKDLLQSSPLVHTEWDY